MISSRLSLALVALVVGAVGCSSDPKADPGDPTWYAVDLAADRAFARPVTLEAMKSISGLEDMFLLRKGMRLSVQPVTPEEWTILTKLGAKT